MRRSFASIGNRRLKGNKAQIEPLYSTMTFEEYLGHPSLLHNKH